MVTLRLLSHSCTVLIGTPYYVKIPVQLAHGKHLCQFCILLWICMSLVIRPHTTDTGAILTHPVLYVNVLLRKDDCGVTSEPTLMIVVLPYNTVTVCTKSP